MIDLVNISIGNAAGYALLGYLVVFFGLVLLMCVIFVMGKIMHKDAPKAAPVAAAPAPAAAPAAAPDAAMVMAIVADSLGKPLNELRFISIREVK